MQRERVEQRRRAPEQRFEHDAVILRRGGS
jgi:hypothetical protein